MAQIIRNYFSAKGSRSSIVTEALSVQSSSSRVKRWTKTFYCKQYKNIIQDRFYYISTGNLKPKKEREYQEKRSVELTHSPYLSRKSLQLD